MSRSHAVAPVVVDRGPGDPEVAVVGGVHGDEPSGVRAIRNLLEEDPDFERGVRFVIANPPAFAAGERYLDADLNRSFPGDPDAPERERRLAAHVRGLTEGMATLSLHSTHSTPDPIVFVHLEESVAEIAAEMPVPSVVAETSVVEGTFTDCNAALTLEAGCQGTAAATDTATEQARAFLGIAGALDGPSPEGNPSFYRRDGVLEKPSGASYDLHVENFERVEAGATVATAGDETLEAEEPFVPILVSASGYEDIFGYEGTAIGESLAAARASVASAP
jgi:predicted deacylase